jgi:hypothetical protein
VDAAFDRSARQRRVRGWCRRACVARGRDERAGDERRAGSKYGHQSEEANEGTKTTTNNYP